MAHPHSNQEDAAFHAVIRQLTESGRPFHLHSHPKVCTMAEALTLVPHLTTNLLKTIVFKIKDGPWILAAVHRDDRVDYKQLADAVGVNRTRLRSIPPEQVTSELGFQVGGVGPFPIREDIRVILDTKLKDVGKVFCGSGLNTQTVEIEIGDLRALTHAEMCPIRKTGRPSA